MKIYLKTMLGLAALGMTLLTNTVPTWAGAVVYSGEVSVYRDVTPMIAVGTMRGARYSTDPRQSIGCEISNGTFVSCSATDSVDRSLYCSSYALTMIDAVQRMTDSSEIHFRVDRATGACMDIKISNGSLLLK
jgi:hypothetical protein